MLKIVHLLYVYYPTFPHLFGAGQRIVIFSGSEAHFRLKMFSHIDKKIRENQDY